MRAFEQGNWAEASHQLRIACFGHLDEPLKLVEGLMRLAIAEVQLGDEDAFRRIFARMVELEERFSACSQASVPEPLRERFEAHVVRLVPASTLRSAPCFAALAGTAELRRLADLPPSQRRDELERRLQAEPNKPDLLIEMARLELELRRPLVALDWLDQLDAAAAVGPRAACLRQQAASEGKSCSRMDLSQPFCAGVPDGVVEFRLECLVEAQRWPEAAELLAGLPATQRSTRRVARLARRIDKQLATSHERGAAGGDDPPATEPPEPAAAGSGAEAAVSAPAAPPESQAATPVELGRLRQRLAVSSSANELAALMIESDRLARVAPDNRQAQLLAAEVAYLRSDWPRAVSYFRRAGELQPGEDHLVFYLAVALYETGQTAEAAALLRPVAPRLERTGFVARYIERILAGGAPG